VPHQLQNVSDLSRALREEERQAWQRLIRVLGHELNNSLAPIKSIAGTLASLTLRASMPEDVTEDMRQGLRVIENRVESLNRFMQAYTQLARMPAPTRTKIEISPLVQRVASLERRLNVKTIEGPRVTIDADPDQLEQVLINLIRNAVDASLDSSLKQAGAVEVGWRSNARSVEIFIRDEGPGLLNSDNLFVPFFTTKHGGSGIGLTLSRQIAEAHGGVLQLSNRSDRTGCEAVVALPVSYDVPFV
jgi:two-component system nitrogen regulation sensor histidine kinase NtrY